MLTAHLPSGYVLGRAWPDPCKWVMSAALVGAVLPDIDMIWFYLVDDRAIHHHRYWVHIPAFWSVVGIVTIPVLAWRGWLAPGLAFFAAIAVHLVLDSIGGGILWAVPFNDKLYSLVNVPATQDHWVLSFILHWTFLLELMIWALAGFLFWRRAKS